jgi:SAM-dependent methyltransferase
MLQVARQRAAKNRSKIRFVPTEMQTLDLPKKDWDAAVCLFDSIGYLKSDEAVTNALTAIRDHLRPNGLFIFEFWHAPAMLNEYSPSRVRRWKLDQGEIVRTSETALDRENRLANVDYTINELSNDGTSRTFRESHTNRFFSVDEMRTLLCKANFEAVRFFAGFNKSDPISEKTWHIVAVARKTRL